MRKVWVIVANSGKTLIYKAEDVRTLHLQKVFEHPESHLARGGLVSDRKGSTFFHKKGSTSFHGRGADSMEEPTSIKTKEINHFAHEIGHFLEVSLQNGEYECLYIVAKAPFLGILRQSLSPHVAKVVESEIHKDLTLLRPEQIREYLPPIL